MVKTPFLKKVGKTVSLILVFCIIAGSCAYLTLRLIVRSEDAVLVPDLVNKDIIYALEILSDLGLNTKVKGSEYSSLITKNYVLYQDPEPGAEIKKGRDVRIIISKGLETILMPDLKGMLFQSAHIILEENGLISNAHSITYSKKIKQNTVIEQNPAPGRLIKRGAGVNFLVSRGSQPVFYKMPDLKGLPFDDAIILIGKSSFVAGEIKSLFYADKPLNSIISQNPLSGHRVREGASVDLVINRKAGGTYKKNIYSSTGFTLFRYKVKCGFLKKHVRVNINSHGISNDAFNDFVNPGHEIWLLVPNKNSVLFLYIDDDLVQTKVFDS
ncbi:MAG: PASTA domain-containing protein [Desulfosarcina sp.]|nr:PASTA domain-containing protein [Desulfobacterales bacterium]